jgi:molecular chaperone DnaK (HSP70)
MAAEQPRAVEENFQVSPRSGTLAIDLGSTTTVVMFQADGSRQIEPVDLSPISRCPGEVPSLLWANRDTNPHPLVGRQVIDSGLSGWEGPELQRDFKRWIGHPERDVRTPGNVRSATAERAGEQLLMEIWRRLPNDCQVHRLVLTAPIDHYRGYRQWLMQACQSLPVADIALVDEPTAAALGAGLPPGARLLVMDVGGSTIDMALVALEGGEGRAAPLAQLLRFNGRTLGASRQVLRCARVLGKAGLRLGGRDLDHWILDHLGKATHSEARPMATGLLNAAERLKCRLSDPGLDDTTTLTEIAIGNTDEPPLELRLNRKELHQLLCDRGLLEALDDQLEQTLAGGRRHQVRLDDLQGVMAVGGGAQLPLLLQWLERRVSPVPLITPPPVEAVARGALALTPGVQIRDVLRQGVSLRCWDQRGKRHHWHPLFVAGQTWPTLSPLEIVLAAGRDDQTQLELVLGEPDLVGRHEVVFRQGLPTLRDSEGSPTIRPWPDHPVMLPLLPPGRAGQDCLRLRWSLDDAACLCVEIDDLRSGAILPPLALGTVR